MLTFRGRVKILDFGIALRRGRLAPVTLVGELRGKPAYMAPEQLDQDRVDRRSDVELWSRPWLLAAALLLLGLEWGLRQRSGYL